MRQEILVALVALCVTDSVHAQSMFRGGETHSGVYAGQGPREFHRIKWTFPTGARVVSSPVSDGSAIYFGGDDGNIYAVDAKSGKQLWQHRTGGPVSSSAAVVDGSLYIVSYDGKLYALDSRTGSTRWKFATAGERHFEAKGLHGIQPRTQTVADPFDTYLSSPVVTKGIVYFGSGDNNLYAVDAASGELRWKFATGDVVHASPAYADGVVYFGSWDSNFYAVDAASGKEKWRLHTGEDPVIHNQVGFQSSPAVVNGVVYTGCRDSNVYAIDAASEKEKWKFSTGASWVITSPAVAHGKVVFGTSDSSKYEMLDAETGKLAVEQQGKAYVFSSPAIAGDVVFVGVLNGTLEARDFATGKLLWEFQTQASKRNLGWVLTADRKFNAPMLYTSNWEGATMAALERQLSVGSILSSPLVVGGTVYFGSTDGNVYALE
jgi:eukaryotic-like serine/threonine-protein kinase